MSLHTLTFTPAPPLTREAMTYTTVTEYIHASHIFSRTRRPIYRFTLKLEPLTRTQVQSLMSAHAYHQGAVPFYWDGGEFGAIENYNLVGEGDGATRTFYLPNREIGQNSISVETRRSSVTSVWASSAYSLSAAMGMLTFANSTNTIPASGDDVRAKYGCRYRVNFDAEGISVHEVAAGVYSAELKLIENALIE